MVWAVGTFIVATLVTVGTLLVILWQFTKRHDQILREQTIELVRIQEAARKEAQARAEVDLKLSAAKWDTITQGNGAGIHAK